jgi:hypothetical protein
MIRFGSIINTPILSHIHRGALTSAELGSQLLLLSFIDLILHNAPRDVAMLERIIIAKKTQREEDIAMHVEDMSVIMSEKVEFYE